MTGRGQAFTLEAFVAALLLIGSVAFALQVTSVTANTASTSSERAEQRLTGLAGGVLDSAVANESLRPTLLYWDETNAEFWNAEESYYVATPPPTRFGRLLDRTMADRGVPVNVNVAYVASNGTVHEQRLVHYGAPSNGAVRVTTTVTLYDDDRLYTASGTESNVTLANASAFYAPDAAPNSSVYNVVRVEVVAWRA